MGKPIRDALVYREVAADGSVFDIRQVSQQRVAAFVEAGWVVLITSADLRAIDVETVYRSDRDRLFNPPR
jgi:hypothetical protein